MDEDDEGNVDFLPATVPNEAMTWFGKPYKKTQHLEKEDRKYLVMDAT